MAHAFNWNPEEEPDKEIIVCMMTKKEAMMVASELGGTSTFLHGLSPKDGVYSALHHLIGSEPDYTAHFAVASAIRPKYDPSSGKAAALVHGLHDGF